MNKITLDIETIACTDPRRIDYLLEHLKAPKNYKSKEATEKWFDANKNSSIEKTVFDGASGEIVTIGFAINDGLVVTLQRTDSISEKAILQEFFDRLKDFAGECNVTARMFRPLFVGHNLIEFDLRFVVQRSIILGINTHGIKIPKEARHGSGWVFDTLIEWVGFKNKTGGSMDNICNALGIPGKAGFDGSMVDKAFRNKEYGKIANYCADDVSRTVEMYNRMTAYQAASECPD